MPAFPRRILAPFPALVIATLLTGVAAHAQQSTPPASGGADAAKHGVGLGFGQVFLMGDFSTNFENNIGFNLNYAYESGTRFGLLVNVHYNTHSSTIDPVASLGVKGLTPNLKINIMRFEKLTLAAIGGLGALLVSETRGTINAGYTLFTLQGGGMINVDVDPHFRFGPSLTIMKVSSSTDSTATPPSTMGGMMWELFFNVMYFF